MNRREILAGAGALAVAGCEPQREKPATTSAAAAAKDSGGDPFLGAKLMRDVDTYVGFGGHRSGSDGDLATSDWFATRWAGLRYAVDQKEFPLPNADTTTAELLAGPERIAGFAQPPLVFTPEDGLTGPLAYWRQDSPADVSGRIAVVHFPRAPGALVPQAAYRDAFERCARANALAVVAVMSSPPGEAFAINTPADMIMDIPVLTIGDKHKPRIEAAMAGRQRAKLMIQGPGGYRNARNTIARRGVTGPWVVVSTPQSGWFTCGGERGPGIAMSLALSEWAAQRDFPVRFLFVATSGHEWTDFGAHLFHESDAPDPKDTALWFHLGASFGARAYRETTQGLQPLDAPNPTRSLMLTEDLMASAKTAFAGQVTIEQPLKADVATALGEYRLVAEKGYPSSAGFWGAHALFHTPVDGAEATSGALMEPIARAVAKVIEERIARI
jgi:hypothetical protein